MWFKKRRIYADAAAATPLSRRARREFVRLLDLYGNAGALHKEGMEAKAELERARKAIAQAIGAHPDEIIFTASGTEANNLAIQGVFKEGHAITSAIEHHSVLEPLRHRGLPLTEVGVQQDGLILPSAVAMAITPQTQFVSIQLVNSEIGAIEPVREIAKEIRRAKHRTIYFHTDASQAPLWVAAGVEQLGVDLMTLDAQKVLGPKGVGALYVRRGTPIEAILRGGSQEAGRRGGTPNVPQAGAFALALSDAVRGVERRAKKTAAVRDYCWEQIKALVPETVLNGPSLESGKRVANNINVSIPGLDAQMAVVALDTLGIATSTRSACTMGDEEPSHVIKALGVSPEVAGTAIRLTLLPGASKADARRIARALLEVTSRYRRSLV